MAKPACHGHHRPAAEERRWQAPDRLVPYAGARMGRARAGIARSWEQSKALPQMYGGSGMGAQRAAWQVAFRAEAAACVKDYYAQTLLDLVKAFETLPHHLIAAAARKHGYSMHVLRLSVASYRMERTLGVDGAFSRPVTATRGITAGSTFATTELRLLLLDVVLLMQRAFPAVTLTLYVDDATLEAWSSSQRHLVALLAAATDCAVDTLQNKLLLEVSAKKSTVVGATQTIARSIAAASTTKACTPARHAKLLGVGSVGGRRRTTLVMQQRANNFRKKIPRIRALRQAGVSAMRLVRTSGTLR